VRYYQRDLALIHDRGYGGYADHCAPGILELLAPVRELPDGLVLEVGCGSGALTRHLLAAGLRVVATDASPDMPPVARVAEDWVIVTEFSAPAPDRFVREATTFVPDGAGAWRRGHERHENVLIDTSRLPGLLAAHGVRAEVGTAFGTAELPPGLRSVTGRKDLYRTGPRARPGHLTCPSAVSEGHMGWTRAVVRRFEHGAFRGRRLAMISGGGERR